MTFLGSLVISHWLFACVSPCSHNGYRYRTTTVAGIVHTSAKLYKEPHPLKGLPLSNISPVKVKYVEEPGSKQKTPVKPKHTGILVTVLWPWTILILARKYYYSTLHSFSAPHAPMLPCSHASLIPNFQLTPILLSPIFFLLGSPTPSLSLLSGGDTGMYNNNNTRRRTYCTLCPSTPFPSCFLFQPIDTLFTTPTVYLTFSLHYSYGLWNHFHSRRLVVYL